MVKKNQGELATVIQLLTEQNLLKKEVLTFMEAAIYLRMSMARLNRLTEASGITHYEPYEGRIVFRRKDLDNFLLRNKKYALDDVEKNNSYQGRISYE
jgi:hypothetical protein